MTSTETRQQRRARERAQRKQSKHLGILAGVGALALAVPASATTYTVINTNDSGAGSLRDAIAQANGNAGADIVNFSGVSGTITLTTGEIAITDPVDIQGPGRNVVTISGNNSSRIFNIDNGSSTAIGVSMHSLTLTAGNSATEGGAIRSYGEGLTLDDVVISGSTANLSGGGIYWTGYFADTNVNFTLTNSTISGNTSKGVENAGGGVDIEYARGNVHLDSDTISNNQAASNAGGLNIVLETGGTMQLLSSFITNNTGGTSALASGSGGGIRLFGDGVSNAAISNSVISGNVADANDIAAPSVDETKGYGGGLYIAGTVTAIVRTSTIVGNTAYMGGGVYIFSDANVMLQNDTITNNRAQNPVNPGKGGGVRIEGGLAGTTVFIEETTIAGDTNATGNSAQAGGGGIDIDTSHGNSTTTLYNTIVANNNGGTEPDVNNNGATLNATYSLIKTPGATVFGGGTGNITGTDPALGPLANNNSNSTAGDTSGTFTNIQTLLPLCTSPVINAGDPAYSGTPNNDARGKQRPAGGRVDMGSVEFQPSTIQFVSTTQSVAETAGTTTITAQRLNGGDGAVSVSYTTNDGTATQPADYMTASGTLNWATGDLTTKSFNVTINDDNIFEGNETFTATLSNPTCFAVLGANTTNTVTINDNEAQPTISIGDLSINEGNAGTTNFVFPVTLSGPSAQTVKFDFATQDVTATSPSDFFALSGTGQFNPLVTSQTITVGVNGDTTNEANETFLVNLTNPQNATINDGQAQGTILNDDAQPSLTINSPSQAEGNAGTSNMTFTVTLTPASGQTVTVNYATGDGTATQPGDYTTTSGMLTFNAGVTTQPINVPIVGDTTAEANETFTVTLSGASNALIGAAVGTGTIQNDDASNADVSILKTGPANAFLGQNGTFNITVTNNGPATAANVVVTDVLPSSMSFVSATPSQGSCNNVSGTVTCNLGAINNAGTATIALTAQFLQVGQASNTATVSAAPQPDPNPANNSSTSANVGVLGTNIPAMSEKMLLMLAGVLAAMGAWFVGRKS